MFYLLSESSLNKHGPVTSQCIARNKMMKRIGLVKSTRCLLAPQMIYDSLWLPVTHFFQSSKAAQPAGEMCAYGWL